MTTDEKIQAYLDGELNDSNLLAFEKELSTNEALRARYADYLVARDLSKGLLEIDMRKTLENESRKSFSIPKWVWLAAILSIGALGVYFVSTSIQEKEELFAEVYKEPLWPITRGGTDSLSSTIAIWKNTGDLQNAKLKIESIKSIDADSRNYWIAEMFLSVGEKDSAEFYLPEISKDHMKYKRVQKIKSWLIN